MYEIMIKLQYWLQTKFRKDYQHKNKLVCTQCSLKNHFERGRRTLLSRRPITTLPFQNLKIIGYSYMKSRRYHGYTLLRKHKPPQRELMLYTFEYYNTYTLRVYNLFKISKPNTRYARVVYILCLHLTRRRRRRG